MHILIVKLGAMGDVVRTSYLVNALSESHRGDLRITWVTDESCLDLLRFNPFIHSITTIQRLTTKSLSAVDWVLSLDDEREVVELASALDATSLTGAYIHKDRITYTPDSADWFDMGLISRFGRDHADRLKKANRRTHGEIFSTLFRVPAPKPAFFGNPIIEAQWRERRQEAYKVVGFNLFAGRRWPSKELPPHEGNHLIAAVLTYLRRRGTTYKLVVFCDQSNLVRAQSLASGLECDIWDCSRSALDYAAAIKACDYIFSTDSLGLHLAIAQKVPNLSFYAPTSAQEIDTFGTGIKVISEKPDYCSYRPDADNSDLTARNILDKWYSHVSGQPEWQ